MIFSITKIGKLGGFKPKQYYFIRKLYDIKKALKFLFKAFKLFFSEF